MKKFLRKIQKVEHRFAVACSCAALLVILATAVSAGIPQKAYAWIISISYSYTPVTSGNYTTISWYGAASDYCILTGPAGKNLPCYNNPFPAPGQPSQTCYVSINGSNGSVYTGPITGATPYTIQCKNVSGGTGSSEGNGTVSFNVTPGLPDNCPNTPTSVANGFQLPPGNNYHIVAQGYNFCVNNGSGKYLFIQTNVAVGVSSFYSATQGYLSGSVAYYARTAGY